MPVEERIEHVVSTFSEFKGIVLDILTGLKLRGKPEELYYCDYRLECLILKLVIRERG